MDVFGSIGGPSTDGAVRGFSASDSKMCHLAAWQRNMRRRASSGGTAHHLINRSSAAVVYLEVGDRARGDSATYPDDDLKLALNEDGTFRCLHKDGTPY